ncbi:MAG: hypothetical protein V1787_04365 [Candidatus Micrarchaeota archaeon]
MKLPAFLALAVFFSLVSACGCGIALGPPEVFNNLKEPNAVLLVDVNEDGTFHMKPFFRFVSLDEPRNVTLVFPMKALPKYFKAERTTLRDFVNKEDLSSFDVARERQSPAGVAGMVAKDAKYFAPFAAVGVVGTIGIGALMFFPLIILRSSVMGAANNQIGAMTKETGIISHYEFEGGSLDIFDASSNATMAEIASRLGYQYDPKLAALIDKYRNHFVSVLNLGIETPLPPDRMAYFRNSCPYWHNLAKQALKEKKIDFAALGLSRPGYYGGSGANTNDCKTLASLFIQGAAGDDSYTGYSVNRYEVYPRAGGAPKGVLLDMGFEADDPIFYPVSVVESYNYPVAQQQYLVRVGKDREFSFTSSQASATALVGGMRWYEITSTAEDLEGTVVPAGAKTGLDDWLLMAWQTAYYNAIWIALALYLALVVAAWALLRQRFPEISLPLLVGGGAIYAAYKLWGKDRNAAIILAVAAVAFAAFIFV